MTDMIGVEAKPLDSRCRYWAKALPLGVELPLAADVGGAKDIPGAYERSGETVYLAPGDFLLEGEQIHHVKERGWMYTLCVLVESRKTPGKILQTFVRPSREIKTLIANGGAPREELAGSGELAACVRLARALRAGWITPHEVYDLETKRKTVEEILEARKAAA